MLVVIPDWHNKNKNNNNNKNTVGAKCLTQRVYTLSSKATTIVAALTSLQFMYIDMNSRRAWGLYEVVSVGRLYKKGGFERKDWWLARHIV